MDPTRNQQEGSQEAQDELMNLMTVMYITIQVVLSSGDDMAEVHKQLGKIHVPGLSSERSNCLLYS